MQKIEKLLSRIDRLNLPILTDLKDYWPIVAEVRRNQEKLQALPDQDLKSIVALLRTKAAENTFDELLIDAFGLAAEVCRRELTQNPFDEQIAGGILLHKGALVEMKTGEGKTLAAVLPAFLNTLKGKKVFILTFNDYLAKRDAEWMEPIYSFLGVKVGYIQQDQSRAEKKQAYSSDIIYATAKELGFDFLRSSMAFSEAEYLVPEFNFAIVDEADAIMVDEARNPLILAGKIRDEALDYHAIATFIEDLELKVHFDQDERSGNYFLLDEGRDKVLETFQIESLEVQESYSLHAAIMTAIQAKYLLQKEVDYLIESDRVIVVDEFTGRRIPDRKWRNGLQTAVEVKEGLPVRSEGTILNSITLQHLLQKFDKLAGMTATAQPAAEEFEYFYKMSTAVIPTHEPCIRQDLPDQLFTTKAEKIAALLDTVKREHNQGRPILIGTQTVAESEALAMEFKKAGLNFELLNAKNDAVEAAIVAQAGGFGAITIATNMAGRGTDIVLGAGKPTERQKVIDAGGLLVLGTNRHESLRIDQQLRGRAGRQGDPGASQFFISYEDHLMEKYEFRKLLPKKFSQQDYEGPISETKILEYTDIAQGIVAAQLYDRRKIVYQFSSFTELQRQILADERQKILLNPSTLFPVESKPSEILIDKTKTLVLSLYDQAWAYHLDEMTEMQDNVQFVKLGGQRPLWIFRKLGDLMFEELCEKIDLQIAEAVQQLLENPDLDLDALGFKRPGSTWTYVLYNNPFGNNLSITLLDNSNIGLQVDFFTAPILFVKGLIEKWKQRRQR